MLNNFDKITMTLESITPSSKPREISLEELDQLEFPYKRSLIEAEYKKFEYEYDPPIEARVWSKHFKPLASGQQKNGRRRPITMEVHSVSRLRNKGREWITFQVCYRSEDWRYNPISFSPSSQGVYKMPRFRTEIDVNTNEPKPGTAQIDTHHTFYDIPFSKNKILELLGMFSEDMEPGPSNLTVVDSGGRRHSCNREEFVNEGFDDLVNLKTGFADYMADREKSRQKRK